MVWSVVVWFGPLWYGLVRCGEGSFTSVRACDDWSWTSSSSDVASSLSSSESASSSSSTSTHASENWRRSSKCLSSTLRIKQGLNRD